VHLCRFLLKKCGNDPQDALMRAVLAMRDSPPPGGLEAIRVELEALSESESVAGEAKKVELIKWMLSDGSALPATFPPSAGALSRTEVLVASQRTTRRIQSTFKRRLRSRSADRGRYWVASRR